MRRLIARPWHQLRSVAVMAGVGAASVGAIVLLVGWGMGVLALRSPLRDFPAMRPNTALGVGSLGFALAVSQLRGLIRRSSILFTVLAAAIGVITLVEYGFNWDAGIDRLLVADTAIGPDRFSGRPAPLTAVTLILLSIAQLPPESRPWQYLKSACSLCSLLITWTFLNGYLFAHTAPPGPLPFDTVAVHTAAALFVVALGTLASQPSSWPVRTVFANNLAGTVCRWLLPVAMVAPPLLGWLLASQSTLREADAALCWALYSVFSSAGSVGLILILAHRIELLDAERTAATAMSRHDPLTGLANRRVFDGFLLEAFNRARRYGRPLSLLTIDIDHFKAYNDSFGHPAGDEVLQRVAKVFSEAARETDLVARIGGEEFAIVMPETPASGARTLAERVRESVAALRLRRVVTVSVGVASLPGNSSEASALLEESDGALYEAKRGGRNRVAVSDRMLKSKAG